MQTLQSYSRHERSGQHGCSPGEGSVLCGRSLAGREEGSASTTNESAWENTIERPAKSYRRGLQLVHTRPDRSDRGCMRSCSCVRTPCPSARTRLRQNHALAHTHFHARAHDSLRPISCERALSQERASTLLQAPNAEFAGKEVNQKRMKRTLLRSTGFVLLIAYLDSQVCVHRARAYTLICVCLSARLFLVRVAARAFVGALLNRCVCTHVRVRAYIFKYACAHARSLHRRIKARVCANSICTRVCSFTPARTSSINSCIHRSSS